MPSMLMEQVSRARAAGGGLLTPLTPSPNARVLPCPSFPSLCQGQPTGCWPNLPHPSLPYQVIRCRRCSPSQLPTDLASPATSSQHLPRPTGIRPGCPMREKMSSQASGLIRWDPCWFPHNFTCLARFRENMEERLRLHVLLSQPPSTNQVAKVSRFRADSVISWDVLWQRKLGPVF